MSIYRTRSWLIGVSAVVFFAAGSYVVAYHSSQLLTAAKSFPICTELAQAGDPNERAFLAANETAMTKMMAGMTITPMADVDRDFVEMMVAHHQGAIDMAHAQLRYGRNAHLARIAQEIIVTQLQEIAAMRLAVGQPLPSSVTSQDQLPSAVVPSPAYLR